MTTLRTVLFAFAAAACGGGAKEPSAASDSADIEPVQETEESDTAGSTPTSTDTSEPSTIEGTGSVLETGDTAPQTQIRVFIDGGEGWVTSATVHLDGVTSQAITSYDSANQAGDFSSTLYEAPPGGGCVPASMLILSDLDFVEPDVWVAVYIEQPGVQTAQVEAPYGYEFLPFGLMMNGVVSGLSGGAATYRLVGPNLHEIEWSSPSVCDMPAPFVHSDCRPVADVLVEVEGELDVTEAVPGVVGTLSSSVPGVPLCKRP